MRKAWFDGGKMPRAILIGYAPESAALDDTAPLVCGRRGRDLERLAGVPRNALPYYFATAYLFVKHKPPGAPVAQLLCEGTKLLDSFRGRVLVTFGVGVRTAFRLEAHGWGAEVRLPEHLVYVLPDIDSHWYLNPGNLRRAQHVLDIATLRSSEWHDASR